MDHAAYHVLYVDGRISQHLDGRYIQNEELGRGGGRETEELQKWEDRNPDCWKSILGEIEEIRVNLKRLLGHFEGVHTCTSGRTCMANLRRLDTNGSDPTPMLVLSRTSFSVENDVRTSDASDMSSITPSSHNSEGLLLIQQISTETAKSNLSKLVLPIAIISDQNHVNSTHHPLPAMIQARSWLEGLSGISSRSQPETKEAIYPRNAMKCIDAGAVDVLYSPLNGESVHSMVVRAYLSHKEATKERAEAFARKKSRKLSWLGNTENKPYAYLREKMVSELMTGICNPEEHLHLGEQRPPPALEPVREEQLKEALGSWEYSGHDYSEEELIHAASYMLQHALALPELERWRLSPTRLTRFLMACRAAYNEFVDYHNFRHVIDVMQAIFYFLIQIGTLPRYPASQLPSGIGSPKIDIASLLRPVDALTLLITAIGHDVGHPGVNNAFLVALNAPLAQLYNDRSVLEAFHCAAYSQILRRYWKSAFEEPRMRSLMINSILATDMGVHQKYMTDLGHLQEKLHHQQGIDGFHTQQLEEYRTLTCALLVKCADISNVARPYDIAVKWANILQIEFANQGTMEQEVGIPTTLFGGPPELGNLVKLGQSQNSFINFFARPLFEAVSDILPAMAFAVDELRSNQTTWTDRIRAENQTSRNSTAINRSAGALSPRSRSPNLTGSQPSLSHPEGLPASSPSPEPLLALSEPPPALLPHMGRSSDTTSIVNPHIMSDRGLHSVQASRRSSHNPVATSNTRTDSTVDTSRRSSGALSTTSNPNVVIAPRRTSNGSPSQLQLAPGSKSYAKTLTTASENRTPNGRGSEDTLSHMHFTGVLTQPCEHREGSANSGGAGDNMRRSSKANDQARSNTSISHSNVDRPYVQYSHRTSSGAHTNNTNLSQSTPYSPTGTQATSVLSIDSEEKGSSSPLDSLADRNGGPKILDVERPGNSDQHSALAGVGGGVKDVDVKTSVLSNGSLRSSDWGHRSIGKKNSRFNIFHWKRRTNRLEATP